MHQRATVIMLALLTLASAAHAQNPSMSQGPETPLGAVEESAVIDQPGEFVDGGCDLCQSCGTVCCAGPAGTYWARAEYLLWWAKGMTTVPLVTAGSTGDLDNPDTVILYGGDDLLNGTRSGFRVRLGKWLDCERRWALEGEYWWLNDASETFSAASDAAGSPNLFRPFFNINPRNASNAFDPPAREDAEEVSRQDILRGRVTVDAESSLHGAGIWLRRNLCCEEDCVPSWDLCREGGSRWASRFDFVFGYRYLRLTDNLTIVEDLTSLQAPLDHYDILDSFASSNTFNGLDLGWMWDVTRDRWSLELLGRLALGNVTQHIEIAGQTAANNGDAQVGGLLAQRTNIGSYERNVFAVAPQLGLTLGYQLTPCLRATVGYTFLYLSRVARAAEQIDRDVNPDLLPPQFEPFAGPLRPAFSWVDNDYWAQGMNLGLEFTW